VTTIVPFLVAVVLSVPCVYWTQGISSRPALDAAGVTNLCVPGDQADLWRAAGVRVVAISDAELSARVELPTPGVTARAGVASPTRAPWIVANGWRIARQPGAKYSYTPAPGAAALAAAEAYAYGADAIMKIDPADVKRAGDMLTFLESLSSVDLPDIADIGLVDDGSAQTGEVMNLLSRRNLLYRIVRRASPQFPLNVVIGSRAYPRLATADPSAFALRVRRDLTDERRSLRIYGSEVVIARLTGNGERVRLHLINYGSREIGGLRIRLRGSYTAGDALVAGLGRVALEDRVVADGATEFSLPRLTIYGVVDLR
jgi:hypothetical protein